MSVQNAVHSFFAAKIRTNIKLCEDFLRWAQETADPAFAEAKGRLELQAVGLWGAHREAKKLCAALADPGTVNPESPFIARDRADSLSMLLTRRGEELFEVVDHWPSADAEGERALWLILFQVEDTAMQARSLAERLTCPDMPAPEKTALGREVRR